MPTAAINTSNKQADDIRKELYGKGRLNTEYVSKNGIAYKLCDVASLFVMTAYLSELPEKKEEKNELRKSAYETFLNGDRSSFPIAWQMLDKLTDDKECTDDIKVKALKGGSYKIKNYYLENYKLRDIRGASVLLTHVEEDIIPAIISEKFIPECIIYSGGGNIFAVVPEGCEEDFALELEKAAKKLLISADIAYYISDSFILSDIFGSNYRNKMVSIENDLNERKKLIINCAVNSSSEYIDKSIKITSEAADDCFDAPVRGTPVCEKIICAACGKRNADYSSGNEYLCASCLHKRAVGDSAKRSRYINRYNKINKTDTAVPVNDLKQISDKYIAVIYGDGNNMGGIIQQFTKITQMMEFSRDVKSIVDKAVFEAMHEHKMTRFEIVGLGGDDVFIIVEGVKAIRFAVSMIKKYNSQFEKYRAYGQVSTMSAGIAIAKYNMPIRIIIDKAEEKLSEAKSIAKIKSDNCGSLSFEIMDTFDGGSDDLHMTSCKAADTMLPYYTDTAENIIELAQKFADSKNKTRLRNVLDAFMNAESADEANLFLKYFNAKSKEAPVVLPPAAGYTAQGGFYISPDGQKAIVWKDIINMLDFIE